MGLGVGAPGNITRKAANVLEQSDFVYAPISERSQFSKARERMNKIGGIDGEVRNYTLPMHSNRDRLGDVYDRTAEEIAELVGDGSVVSAVTLGDPLLYSTCYYLSNAVQNYLPNEQVHFHTGISSPQIAVARLRKKLARSNESVALIPCKDVDSEKLNLFLEEIENIIFMKVNKNRESLIDALSERDRISESYYVRDLGGEDERIAPLKSVQFQPQDDYFAMVLVLNDD